MNHENERFIPEAVDEQVDRLLELPRRPQQPATFIEPEAHLIQDLARFTQEYQLSGNRVWQRLEEHVRNNMQEKETYNAKKDKSNYTQRRSPKMQQTHSLRYPYGSRPISRTLAIIAAMLIAALVVGSTIAILTLGRHPGSPTAAPKHPQNNVRQVSPTPVPTPDYRYCNSGDTGWDTLCNAQQIDSINITKTFTSKMAYTINAGYADNNRVLFYSTMQPPSPTVFPNVKITDVKTKAGVDLTWITSPNILNQSTGLYSTLSSFSTDGLIPSYSRLDLQLTLSDNGAPDTITVNLSLPFHEARVANPNQTITINNVAINLSRVVVAGSSTWIYLRNPQLADLAKHSPKGTFDVSVYNITVGSWSPSWISQAFMHMYANPLTQPLFDTQAPKEGFLIRIDDDLFDKHGNWTFTISKDAIAGATSDWVFHFTVPN